jgi:hypothetical protein
MSNSIFHVRPLDSGKGWAILIRPNVKLLAEFCSNVSFDDAGQDA